MSSEYRAVIKHDGEWWIGWVEEVPGVNSQGRTRDELMGNLQSALVEMLEMNRQSALGAAGADFEEITISA